MDKVADATANRLNGEVQMSDETAAAANQSEPRTEAKTAQKRQRSAVAFAYIDLEDVMAVAAAIHTHVGTGDCDEHQLAAWLSKSQKSSGFRILLSTARLFGLLETDGSGRSKLAPLGRMAVDPTQAREAKAKAFLTVPLYSVVFEKYKGGVLPPPAALERAIVQIGVAEKQKHTARLVLERSAQYAGFSEHGKDRLVMPGISPDSRTESTEPPNPNRSGGSGGGNGKDPLILALIEKLPATGAEWPVEDQALWLQMAAMAFRMAYGAKKQIEIKVAGGSS